MMEIHGLEISTRDAYPPSEDTYLLMEVMENEIKGSDEVLEIGVGSGLLSLVASLSAERVTGVDIDKGAVEAARENAKKNGIDNVEFFESDLFEEVDGNYDLVVFNPPYLPGKEDDKEREGHEQWYGGETGREIIERFVEKVDDYLTNRSKVLMVVSSSTGVEETEELFEAEGFEVEAKAEKKIPWERLYVLLAK